MDDLLSSEDAVNKILLDLTKVEQASNQIEALQNIATETIKIGKKAIENSNVLLVKTNAVLDKIDKAKMTENFESISKKLDQNQKINTITLLILGVVITLQIVKFFI